MIKPTRYQASVIVSGQVDDFRELLDPRNWDDRARDIWRQSFLVAEPSNLKVDLSDDPEKDHSLDQLDVWRNGWFQSLLFEDVFFAAFRYRNLLVTTFERSNASIKFSYMEHQCLTTVSRTGSEVPGGVDVDHGFAEAAFERPGFVKITFSKTVRFTQPKNIGGRLNSLAHLLVPLSFDAWTHAIAFSRSKKNGQL